MYAGWAMLVAPGCRALRGPSCENDAPIFVEDSVSQGNSVPRSGLVNPDKKDLTVSRNYPADVQPQRLPTGPALPASKSGKKEAAGDIQPIAGEPTDPNLKRAFLQVAQDAPAGQVPPVKAPPPPPPPAPVTDPASPRVVVSKIAPPLHREPIVEAFQCILEDRHPEALTHLQKYDQPTQELFLRLLPPMALLTKKGLDKLAPAEVAVLNDQLQSLLTTLRPRTELAINKICFCESIKGYGNYKPLAEEHSFMASTGNRPGELVQMYVEVKNFSSELRAGVFETKLASTVEIRDGKGDQVWFHRFDDGKTPLKSRTHLNDYFNHYSFYVPNNMPPGAYKLTVEVTDETRPETRRTARKTLEFRVTGVANVRE
jgi:hypothetical protein